MPQVPPVGLDSRLGYWLREVSNLLHERFAATLAAHGVSPPLWAILITVHRGEARTPAALARRLDADPAAMTRRLDQLEEKGLTVRRRSARDRRSVRIELTPRGETLVPELAAISSQLTDGALEGVSEGERARLLRALQRMHQNLKAIAEASSTDAPEASSTDAPEASSTDAPESSSTDAPEPERASA